MAAVSLLQQIRLEAAEEILGVEEHRAGGNESHQQSAINNQQSAIRFPLISFPSGEGEMKVLNVFGTRSNQDS
jgi:hypothetical protein